MADRPSAPEIDTSVPHSARVWNYWLGGKDNYPADRELGDQVKEVFPGIVDLARAGRAFLKRTIRYLAGEAGIRQFLDVGTGLPTADNTHQIAQRVAPEARIVYVDNDPLVLAHAEALLTSTPEGRTDYVFADLREPDVILTRAADTLDLTRPIALSLMGIMGHVADYSEARSIVSRLLDGLPSGSYLALYDGSATADDIVQGADSYNDSETVPYIVRPPEEIKGFFEGLELVEPGVVPIQRWRPEESAFAAAPHVDAMGGVGRKP
jgi:O-Methyltransferase involved in polyketide biosynthesis